MTVKDEGATPTPDPIPETTPEQIALLAMDAGVNDEPMPEIPEPKAEAPKPGSPAAEVKGKDIPKDIPTDAETPKTPQDAASAPDKAGDKKAEPTPEEAAKAAADAEIAKEADALGLKEKARERFTSLVSEVKAAAPFREAAEKLGIKSPEELPRLAEQAKIAVDMVEMVRSTGATPQQYDMALNYLDQINKGLNGDTKAAGQCWEWLMEELKSLAPIVGKEVPGIVDPLAEHPDLARDVENGDISRARALELAQQRTTAKAREAAEQLRRQTEQQKAQQQQGEQKAIEAGKAALTALGNELAAADPAAYQAKFPMLAHIVKTEIVPKFPPDQWAAKAALAWAKIVTVPAQPAAPARATPAPSPVRSSGPTPPALPQFDDPMAALNAALDMPD